MKQDISQTGMMMIALALIVGALILAWYWVWYLDTKVESLYAQSVAEVSLNEKQAELRDLKDEERRTHLQREQVRSLLLPEDAIPDFLGQLEQLGTGKLVVESVEPRLASEELVVAVSYRSSYEDIVAFLGTIHRLPYASFVESADITTGDDGVWVAQIRIKTLMRTNSQDS